MGMKCLLSLESAAPIEGPELTKLAARALRESMQGRSAVKVGQTALPLSARMGRHLWAKRESKELAEFERIISRQDNTGQRERYNQKEGEKAVII